MEWKDLSNEAKGVIEWIVNPFTDKKETVEIKIGETFHRDCPLYCGDYDSDKKDVNVLITKELYQEILQFIAEDENIEYTQSPDGLIFRIAKKENTKEDMERE